MKAVLDASALLAYLQEEKGAQSVETVIDNACISAVNWSEVMQKALARGVDTEGMRADLEALGLVIEPFTAEQAALSARLWPETRKLGLSLGDRACLGLGQFRGLPVLTADREWKKLKLDMDIQVLRCESRT